MAFFSKVELGVLDRLLELFGKNALFFYCVHLFVFGFIAAFSPFEPSLKMGIAYLGPGLFIMALLCWLKTQATSGIFKRKKQNKYPA